jgi:GT2 family glycosyltransferase
MSIPDTAAAFEQYWQHCPWEHFDADWYCSNHMRRLPPTDPSDPFEHYNTIGVRQKYSPNPYFDEAWYLSQYPDVKAGVSRGVWESGFAHYRLLGHIDRDPHWLFCDSYYRENRGDLPVEDMARSGLRNGYHHYLIAGQNERCSGSPFFDASFLAESTGIVDKPFTALLQAPWLGSLRLSQYFDTEWYVASHDNVEDMVADGEYGSALHHYLTNPTPWRFPASPDFDEAYYSVRYPDIAEAVAAGALRSGYIHFVLHGRFEDRQPSPWFDPGYYRRNKVVASALRNDPALTAFDHYQRTGQGLGLPAVRPVHLAPIAERPATEAAGKDIFVRMAHLWAQGSGTTLVRLPEHKTAPDISVVMCAFNHYDLTIQTLLHLSGSTGVSFEVILVDNASSDATRTIETRVSGLQLIRNATNAGFLRATNQGIAAACGKHVLLLNNDVILPPNALHAALQRLESDPTIGAVGGKIVRTHGLLQEAGCILFSNGSALGYGRDADPFEPDYNFVRDVDYCSGVFLMVPMALMRALDGLDPDYAPAYYEETDLCARIWKSGRRVVYDPSIVVVHLEFGSSRNPDAPRALMRRNRETFQAKHREWLLTKTMPELRHAIVGRTATRRPRVLFVEDTIPYRHIGSGFVRSADVVASLVSLGCDVTVLPMNPVEPPPDPRQGFDERVELLWNRDATSAARLLVERAHYYDVIWVCRAHNLHRLVGAVSGGDWGALRHARIVLDTEALACNRDAALAALEGRKFDLERAMKRELRHAYLAQDICCVSATEQAQLLRAGLPRVSVLGHAIDVAPTGTGFAKRRDILALGSLYGAETPNVDGLSWFIAEIWPLVRKRLGDVRLLIAGYTAPGFDAETLLAGPDIVHLGFVQDASELYETSRLFLAPTRFSAGIPFKVHEAAARGLPVMATTLLADQLGWESGTDLASHRDDDPAGFAKVLCAAYSDAKIWKLLRDNALARISAECGRQSFTAAIGEILQPAAHLPR